VSAFFKTLAVFLLVVLFFYGIDLFIMESQHLPLNYDLTPDQRR
jgi:hypothetical protein